MTNKKYGNQSSVIRAISLLVNLFWIVAILGVCLTAILIPFRLIRVFTEKVPIYFVSAYFFSLFSSVVYLWIIYFLRKLMLTVKESNPFDQMNPGRIRRIAYGVFALVPLDIFAKIWTQGFQPTFSTTDLGDILWGSLFKLTFLGFGILVIAKVFELGVVLKDEQKLTI
jgi:hypothetical protein